MRAICWKDSEFSTGQTLKLDGEKFHHLTNVVRIKQGNEILVLDGKGKIGNGLVGEIAKRYLTIDVLSVDTIGPGSHPSIAFALTKKDALEFCLRACVEIGAPKIYILSSERAQQYPLKMERIKKILIAGLEQSNNAFLPAVKFCELNELPLADFDKVGLATLAQKKGSGSAAGKTLLVIGPEGGFTEEEEAHLLSRENVFALNFEGPILRTQTAIPFFAGVLSSSGFIAG